MLLLGNLPLGNSIITPSLLPYVHILPYLTLTWELCCIHVWPRAKAQLLLRPGFIHSTFVGCCQVGETGFARCSSAFDGMRDPQLQERHRRRDDALLSQHKRKRGGETWRPKIDLCTCVQSFEGKQWLGFGHWRRGETVTWCGKEDVNWECTVTGHGKTPVNIQQLIHS